MIYDRRKLWGLPAGLMVLTLLSACSADVANSDKTSTSASITTAAPAVTTTAAAAAPTQAPKRTVKWIDLQVGDCLADPPPVDPSVVTVAIVDCATPHSAEVYSRSALALNSALADVADRACQSGFTQYAGRPVAGSPFTVTYLIDSNQNRTSSNPDPSTVICVLQAANGQPLTESAHR
jgi:hypothetical protein